MSCNRRRVIGSEKRINWYVDHADLLAGCLKRLRRFAVSAQLDTLERVLDRLTMRATTPASMPAGEYA